MVGTVTGFSYNGLRDYLIQRVSAWVLLLYVSYLFYFWFFNGPVSYDAWHGLAQSWPFKVATFVVLLSLIAHAWVGLWTVMTDYLSDSILRLMVMIIVVLVLLGLLGWGLFVLCGI